MRNSGLRLHPAKPKGYGMVTFPQRSGQRSLSWAAAGARRDDNGATIISKARKLIVSSRQELFLWDFSKIKQVGGSFYRRLKWS